VIVDGCSAPRSEPRSRRIRRTPAWANHEPRRLSINQPILAMVLSIVLLIVARSLTRRCGVGISQVAPPTVTVTTQYPALRANRFRHRCHPDRAGINGVEDMLYLYSQATSNGQLTIT